MEIYIIIEIFMMVLVWAVIFAMMLICHLN